MSNYKKRRPRRTKISLINSILTLLFLTLLFVYSDKDTQESRTTADLENQYSTMVKTNFISEIAPLAQEAYRKYNILPSITLAQAALESDFGQSTLASKYHNLFGVKAYGNVPTVSLDTQEFENNQWITIKGSFRVYDNYQASVEGHSKLFTQGTDWNPNQYASVLAAKDYVTAAKAVQSSGYATDPAYADKLIEMIKTYKLDQFDRV